MDKHKSHKTKRACCSRPRLRFKTSSMTHDVTLFILEVQGPSGFYFHSCTHRIQADCQTLAQNYFMSKKLQSESGSSQRRGLKDVHCTSHDCSTKTTHSNENHTGVCADVFVSGGEIFLSSSVKHSCQTRVLRVAWRPRSLHSLWRKAGSTWLL